MTDGQEPKDEIKKDRTPWVRLKLAMEQSRLHNVDFVKTQTLDELLSPFPSSPTPEETYRRFNEAKPIELIKQLNGFPTGASKMLNRRPRPLGLGPDHPLAPIFDDQLTLVVFAREHSEARTWLRDRDVEPARSAIITVPLDLKGRDPKMAPIFLPSFLQSPQAGRILEVLQERTGRAWSPIKRLHLGEPDQPQSRGETAYLNLVGTIDPKDPFVVVEWENGHCESPVASHLEFLRWRSAQTGSFRVALTKSNEGHEIPWGKAAIHTWTPKFTGDGNRQPNLEYGVKIVRTLAEVTQKGSSHLQLVLGEEVLEEDEVDLSELGPC